MIRLSPLAALLLLLAACSDESTSDIPPLPKESAESANALMAEAERAAANAQRRAEPKGASAVQDSTSNEVTR